MANGPAWKEGVRRPGIIANAADHVRCAANERDASTILADRKWAVEDRTVGRCRRRVAGVADQRRRARLHVIQVQIQHVGIRGRLSCHEILSTAGKRNIAAISADDGCVRDAV